MNLKVRVESNTKQQVFYGANMDKSERYMEEVQSLKCFRGQIAGGGE